MIRWKKSVPVLVPLLLLFYLLAFAATGWAVIIDRIVAKINGEIVTLSEVQELRFRLFSQLRTQSISEEGLPSDQLISERELLEKVIDRKLQIQKADKLGIEINVFEIDNTLADILTQNKMNKDDLVKMLSREGATMEDFRKQLKEEMILSRVLNSEVKSKVFVDGQEVGEYYQEHRSEFSLPEKIRLRHILIKVDNRQDKEEVKKARKMAEHVLERYVMGEAFSSLARRFSSDPSAKKGGDIGYVKTEDLMEPLRQSATRLKIGQISPPIPTPLGFHIIFMEEKIGASFRPLEDVRKEIENLLYQKKLQEHFKTWIAQLRENAHIEISYQEASVRTN